MSVVVIATTPGVSPELYDRSQELMGLVGQLPPGCTAHIAGPSPDGWRVVAVWESAEAARQFMVDKLRPALAELGVTPPAGPPLVYPVHAQLG
jgi:hypothetical protein